MPASIMDVPFFSATAGLPASFKTLGGYQMATASSVWETVQGDLPDRSVHRRLTRTQGVYREPLLLAGLKKQKKPKLTTVQARIHGES